MKKVYKASNKLASEGQTLKARVQRKTSKEKSRLAAEESTLIQTVGNQSSKHQDRYFELFNLVSSAVAVYKAVDNGNDFIFTDFNKAAEIIEKTPREKIIGRKVTEVFPGIREMTLLDTFRRVWKTGKAQYHPTTLYKDAHLMSWRENYVYKLPSGEVVAVYEDITERKQAEEKLAKEAIRRRILIEQSRDGIVVLDTDGRVYETNLKFAKMLGYSQEEVLDLHVWDWEFLVPKKELMIMLGSVDEAGDHFETQHKRKDGSVYDVEISTNGSMIAGQKLIFCVCRDITERKCIEMDLRESEERFRSLYENATIGMYRTTPGGKVLIANQALINMLGFNSIEDMTRRNLNSEGFETSSARKEFKQQIEANGEVHGYESVWKTATGSTVFVRESAKVIRDKNGKVLYYEGTVEDISERKNAEKALKDNEIFLNSVIENIPDMIFVKDLPDLRFVRFNKAGEELLGISSQLMYGKNDYDFFPPDEAQHFIKRDKETINKRLLLDIPEEKIQTKDKGERILHTQKIPILDETGKPKYLLGISEDITERKRSEETLRESEERYRSLFEDSPVSLWVEDFSEVKKRLDALRARGVKDMRAYLGGNSEEVLKCATLTRIIDVNKAGVSLLKAKTKADLLINLSNILSPQSLKEFRQELVYLAEGNTKFSWEGKSLTLTGELIDTKLSWSVVPGYESNLSKVLVAIEDISERKRIEATLVESEERFRGLFEDSPISLWEEDFSAVKKHLDDLRAGGVKDMRSYLESHPEEKVKCASLIRILDVNKAAIKLYGAKDKNHLIKNLAKIVSTESSGKFIDELVNISDGLSRFNYETVNQSISGERININLSWAAAPGYEKDLSRVLISIVDITERKQAEANLQESEKRFRGLFEDSPVSILEEDFSDVKKRLDYLLAGGVKDMRSYLESHPEEIAKCASLIKVLDVNKAAIKLYDANDKNHLIKNLAKIVNIEKSGKFIEALVNISDGQSRFNYETVNQTISGERININISWAAAPGYEKDLSRVLISIVDITERKQAEANLRESEGRFRGLFEDSPVSLWEDDFSAIKKRLDTIKEKGVKDMHAFLVSHPEEVVKNASLIKVLDVNKAAVKMYGARDKEHLINNLTQILSIMSSENFIEELVSISNGATQFNQETVNKAIGGKKINISLSWTAAPGHEKDLSRVLVSLVDITERKQAEAKMAHLITELRELSQTEKNNRIFAEALAKNVTTINSSLNADEVLDSIIDSISEIVPYDAASVMMISGDQARIVRSKGYREKGLGKWVEQAEFDLNKIKDFSLIIRNKKYKVTPDTETRKDWTVVKETAWVKSNITFPLMENSQVIGFLNLDSATPGFYSENHAKVLTSFSGQVSTALKNARLFEDTQRRLKRMQAMTQIDLAINSSLDINVSLEIILIQAKDQLDADAVDILLVNKATGSLVFSKAKGFKTDEVRKANFRLGTGLPGKAVLERAVIAIPDLNAASESFFKNLLIEREGFVSYYCAPLITKGELKGVIEIYFCKPFNADQEWREFLELLAQQTAIAINNAELLTSLKKSNADLMNAYETTLKGWVDALDMRDHETEGHTHRVTDLSLELAMRMGIKDSEIINFKRGALLHDIGKVAVPDAILNKPGPLTDEEWVLMRKHPLNALSLLSKTKYLLPAMDIPYSHHEKWDGSGYPRGLKGEAIPLAARIFAVVDVWDALISDRSYRKAWPQKQALEHIQDQSGKHFDPKVVEAFMALLKSGNK